MSSESINPFNKNVDELWDLTDPRDCDAHKSYSISTRLNTRLTEKLIGGPNPPNKAALLTCKALTEYKILEIKFLQFVYDHPILSAAIVTAVAIVLLLATTSLSMHVILSLDALMAFLSIIAIRYGGFKFVKENEALKALLEDLSKKISEWDPQDPEKRIQ